VRELDEVVNDPHLHATGMLQWVQHPEYGEVLVHGSPLVFQGDEPPPYRPSGALGQDTQDVLQRLAGVDAQEFASLSQQGAFR
jgi:formyl-CoA transferase